MEQLPNPPYISQEGIKNTWVYLRVNTCFFHEPHSTFEHCKYLPAKQNSHETQVYRLYQIQGELGMIRKQL